MKMRKSRCLTAALLAALLAGCGSGGTQESIKPPALLQDGTTETSQESTASEAPSEAVTLTEQEVYSAGGITVRVTGLEEGVFGPVIGIATVNDSQRNVTITAQSLSVNGYMLSASGLYSDVASGKKANDELNILSADLEQAEIGTIGEVAFILHISDSDSYETIAESDLITLETSASGSFTQKVDHSGDEVYAENGIRVVCKGLKQDVIWDGAVLFYMENLSQQSVTVYAENVSVNGYMADVSLWADLRPGTRSLEGMYLMDLENMELTGIEDVETMEFSLRIVDGEDWSEIAATGPITVSFE